MHVLLVNGSPHESGCVYTALNEVAAALQQEGVETRLFQTGVGAGAVRGCTGCLACRKSGTHRCCFTQDSANALIDAISAADGVVLGSPVYYAGPNGAFLALLDRAFYAGGAAFAHKPAAAILSCRRGGASAAFDRLNKYFTISQMPVVPSQYWNAVHGNKPDEVQQDLEGLQIMRTLGHNMAFMLRALQNATPPALEKRVSTNFIR